jgi:hypothetical protein
LFLKHVSFLSGGALIEEVGNVAALRQSGQLDDADGGPNQMQKASDGFCVLTPGLIVVWQDDN